MGDAEPLDGLLRRVGRVGPGRAVAMVRGLLADLSELHEAGRAHGRLAPSSMTVSGESLIPGRAADDDAVIQGVGAAFVAPSCGLPTRSPRSQATSTRSRACCSCSRRANLRPSFTSRRQTVPRWADLPEPLRGIVRQAVASVPQERPTPPRSRPGWRRRSPSRVTMCPSMSMSLRSWPPCGLARLRRPTRCLPSAVCCGWPWR